MTWTTYVISQPSAWLLTAVKTWLQPINSVLKESSQISDKKTNRPSSLLSHWFQTFGFSLKTINGSFLAQQHTEVHWSVPRTEYKLYGDCDFTVVGPKFWNKLPPEICSMPILALFKTKLNSCLFIVGVLIPNRVTTLFSCLRLSLFPCKW